MTQKEKILNACRNGGNSIPNENLLNYINSEVVSFDELKNAGLSDEKAEYITQALESEETNLWNEATSSNTLDAYMDYIDRSKLGRHIGVAQTKIDEFDDAKWSEAQSQLSSDTLNDYIGCFPNGKHVDECNGLLCDLPWLETKRKNTIEAYNQYMQQYPGKHDAEAQMAILSIQDDNTWNDACAANSSSAYRLYLSYFPEGKHKDEALMRVNSGAAGEQFLNALQYDQNAFTAYEIQEKVGNGVVTWDDIQNVMGGEKTYAIQNFQMPALLPNAIAPDSLQGNTTEVYFWGTPGSGKTCALGTILSSATRAGIIEPLQCSGLHYMNLLSNIFIGNDCCTLPDSTNVTNIQEMVMKLTDEKRHQHKLTLIDLAGELFRSVYLHNNHIQLEESRCQVLEKAMSYLKNKKNNKIHFFVVEYGAHEKKWDGLNMSNYLSCMIQYLKNEKVFTKSTVGVYVLVTKCDKMDCAKEDRPRLAHEYVKQEFAAFWNTLEMTCKKAAIKDLKTLAFSIGDVFAQQLCVYDGEDTNKVIDKLLTKTPTISRFPDFFRQ